MSSKGSLLISNEEKEKIDIDESKKLEKQEGTTSNGSLLIENLETSQPSSKPAKSAELIEELERTLAKRKRNVDKTGSSLNLIPARKETRLSFEEVNKLPAKETQLKRSKSDISVCF